MPSGGAREGAGRPPGSVSGQIRRLSAVVRARYGLHNDMPLDLMLAAMEYWSAQCAALIEREADAPPPTPIIQDGKLLGFEPDTLKGDLRYAFEQLGRYAERCAPYFHAKVKQVELGGTIDLRRLSYEDLQTLVPLLRKARALTIEQRSESGEDGSPD